jgi:hypothetical protein
MDRDAYGRNANEPKSGSRSEVWYRGWKIDRTQSALAFSAIGSAGGGAQTARLLFGAATVLAFDMVISPRKPSCARHWTRRIKPIARWCLASFQSSRFIRTAKSCRFIPKGLVFFLAALCKPMPLTGTFRQIIPMYTYASGSLFVCFYGACLTPIGLVVPPATKTSAVPG